VSAAASTLFKPGQSGNPKGRPKGSRNKVSEDFLKDLHSAWNETYIDETTGKRVKVGREAIRQVLRNEPAKALAIMTQVLPKDFQLTVTDPQDTWVINAGPTLTVEQWQRYALEAAEEHAQDGLTGAVSVTNDETGTRVAAEDNNALERPTEAQTSTKE